MDREELYRSSGRDGSGRRGPGFIESLMHTVFSPFNIAYKTTLLLTGLGLGAVGGAVYAGGGHILADFLKGQVPNIKLALSTAGIGAMAGSVMGSISLYLVDKLAYYARTGRRR